MIPRFFWNLCFQKNSVVDIMEITMTYHPVWDDGEFTIMETFTAEEMALLRKIKAETIPLFFVDEPVTKDATDMLEKFEKGIKLKVRAML